MAYTVAYFSGVCGVTAIHIWNDLVVQINYPRGQDLAPGPEFDIHVLGLTKSLAMRVRPSAEVSHAGIEYCILHYT